MELDGLCALLLDKIMFLSVPKLHFNPTIFTSTTLHLYMSRARFCKCMAAHSTQDDEATLRHKQITMNSNGGGVIRSKGTTNLMLNQENPVGILGGVSAFTTLVFLGKLVWWSSRKGSNCLPFIVSSGLDCTRGTAAAEIIESLRNKRIFLEQSGSRCIVMPCNVSNMWYKEVSYGCCIEFLNLGDCVTRELQEADLKPLHFCSKVRIGVLASDQQEQMANLYVEKLQNLGYEVVVLDRPTNEHILIPAIEAMRRKDMEGARNLLRIAIQVLLVTPVNKVILVSAEFQDLLPDNDPLIKYCLNPINSLARSTVQFAQSLQKGTNALV